MNSRSLLLHSASPITVKSILQFILAALLVVIAFGLDTDTYEARFNTISTKMASIRRSAPLIFNAKGKHTATVIFLHGLGDSGAGWAQPAQIMQGVKGRLDEVKWILPNAPNIPITLNMGMQMPGWWDIKSLGFKTTIDDEDAPGIQASQAYVHSLIQDEISAGISSERIIVGGFSQGGALSLFAGLTAPVKLGGVIGLSSWLPLNKTFRDSLPESNPNKDTPVRMFHGDRDPVVRYEAGDASQQKLKELGYDVTFNTYRGMEHSSCMDELNDVEEFLFSRLPPTEK
ncbi:hypothetical protein N3K66_006335 [Trichothecium roseum]|uniref:Uncharacterized protein n=1 Tax=Trichothecium roseum TaxID=47278 RepID=A0ACC0UWV0_9HYPO|nr:hypothetical protein N3K66_006335 [Trichothecium roseum]